MVNEKNSTNDENADNAEGKKPYFSRFLEGQYPEVESDVRASRGDGHATGRPGIQGVTMKYPSDDDELVTMKYPSDSDE